MYTAVYMLAADAAVAAAVFGLEHLISYCNKNLVLVLVLGTSERLVPAKKKTERLVPASASLPTAGSALPPVGRATPLLW